MDAALLTEHARPPRFTEYPDPVPNVGAALISVTAAPVVPLDLLCAGGTSYLGKPALPYVPGVQGVGRVVSSDRYPAGTRVFFTTRAGMAPGDGSHAQLCAADDASLIPIEHDLPDVAAAAIGLSGVAAWMALTWKANLEPGETVIVLGAGGAVGQAAIGAARLLGAGRVVGVCRSRRSADVAAGAGADEMVVSSADQSDAATDLADRLRQACRGEAAVVIDPVFGITATAASLVLADGGRLVNIGGAGGDHATFSSSVLRGRSAAILGYTNNSLTAAQRADALANVFAGAASGQISVAHRVVPLHDCAAAWADTQTGGGPRLVLVP